MKKFGYALLALVMIATSAWAVDQALPKNTTQAIVQDEVTATPVAISNEEPAAEIQEMTDGEILPLIAGACCWAECTSEKSACVNACGPNSACQSNCIAEYIDCMESC